MVNIKVTNRIWEEMSRGTGELDREMGEGIYSILCRTIRLSTLPTDCDFPDLLYP